MLFFNEFEIDNTINWMAFISRKNENQICIQERISEHVHGKRGTGLSFTVLTHQEQFISKTRKMDGREFQSATREKEAHAD